MNYLTLSILNLFRRYVRDYGFKGAVRILQTECTEAFYKGNTCLYCSLLDALMLVTGAVELVN